MSTRLSSEQWLQARRRWEGDARDGFDWLAKEMVAAWGVPLSRQGVSVRARREGWEKGGDPSRPLAPVVAQQGKGVAQQKVVVAQQPEPGGEAAEVADEVVEPPAPAERHGPGRPTKYRAEFAEKILTFFNKEPFTEVDVAQPSGLVKRQRLPTDPPMLASFAKQIGVSVRTLNRWAVELDDETGNVRHPEFAEAFARAREFLEALLVRGGVLGLYDPRVVQFALKNLAGWADQPARTSEVAPISKEELEATYIRDMEEAHARQDAIDAERRALLAGEGED